MMHRWSGGPGAFCLDCGCEDPVEIARADDCDPDEITQQVLERKYPNHPGMKPCTRRSE